MSELNLYETTTSANDSTPVRLVYDRDADILEIFFGENEPATGVELTDHIILRLDRQTRRAIGITLLHFSILAERTEYGPRSYPLDKLDELPPDLRELVLHPPGNLNACQPVPKTVALAGIANRADTLYLRASTARAGYWCLNTAVNGRC